MHLSTLYVKATMWMKKSLLFVLMAVVSILACLFWTRLQSTIKQTVSELSTIKAKSQIQTKETSNVKVQEKQSYGDYSEFQLLNDNMTYVYAGYYDDREDEAVVKVIAMIPRDISYKFTCTLFYQDHTVNEVTGYVKYYYAHAVWFMVKSKYRNGYIICPVLKAKAAPTYVLIQKRGIMFPKTKVIVWPPAKETNKLTRCVKSFIRNYDDVSRLIWNIELFQMFGVDKHIIYMENQTKRIVDVLQSYAGDGIVEIRNFSISQPVTPLYKYMQYEVHWGQWSVYEDCLLSQMNSAKYVLFMDMDEVLVPRKYKTIVEMADDLFAQSEYNPKPAGSLSFLSVHYPTFKNITTKSFPRKDIALKYNIHPLLYTTRMKTSPCPKSLVRPRTVDVMFIHYVEAFKNGWKERIVEEDIATMHHYRASLDPRQMHPPETEDNYVLQFSDHLISAIEKRFQKLN